jgi:preprotein translocase subunit SecF
VNFREALANFRGHRVPHLTIIDRKRFWFALSGFFILLSVVGLAVRGLNFSIDFKGGSLLKYPCPRCVNGAVTADDVRSTLARSGFTDAEVQVVNGDTLSVRTRSLTTLGGQPATILRLTNPSGLSADDVRATLASYGRSQASVTANAGGIRIKTQPLSRSEHGVTLTYPNTKALTASAIQTSLSGLGYPGAVVDVIGRTVVVRFAALPVHPPSAPASSGASPSAKSSQTSKKATPTPAPSASPAPTVQGRDAVIAALATQAGVKPGDVTLRDLASASESGVISAVAQQAGVSTDQVQTREVTGKEQQRLLSQLADQAGTTTAQINRQDVGPTWGAQISSKAIKGLIIFLILVTVYIAFRFEWKMAFAAQTALLHDLIITAGIYALVGRTVTPATVIAILTILGYSLYDTVVIFDKVKENAESQAMVTRETYSGVVNISLNQVLMRSVNTSLVVLLPILSLLLFGGSTLKDFAFALFVGVASGTYSSIFLASPALALLKEREPKFRQIRIRAETRRPQLRPVAAMGDGGDREVPAAARQPRAAESRPPASRPKKKRKTTAAQRRRR